MTAENAQERLKKNLPIAGFAIIIIGVVLTMFLWWFFGGFGFWALPGLALLFIGVSESAYKLYAANTNRKAPMLRGGLVLLFIGAACYFSFASYVVFAMFQMISMILAVIGLLLLVAGLARARKN